MFLADYHTHSIHSIDGKDSIDRLANAALDAGMTELAVTDHFDATKSGKPYGKYDQREYFSELEKSRSAFENRLRLVAGVELGQAHHCPELAAALLSGGEYDIILGSVHWLRDGTDFYNYDYTTWADTHRVFANYLSELIELSLRPEFFSVLSHLTLPVRYMCDRSLLDLTAFEDPLRQLFANLISSGRGIEVNTSGFSGIHGEPMPDAWCLRLFRECGGAIVTVGSDAHYARDVGSDIKSGFELLRECGFTSVATFKRLVPSFISIV